GAAHTLRLTTGELSRITWHPGLDWAEAHELEQFGRASPDLLFVPTEDDRDCGDVVGNRVVREEAGLLDRIPDGPPQLDSGLVRDRASADPRSEERRVGKECRGRGRWGEWEREGE